MSLASSRRRVPSKKVRIGSGERLILAERQLAAQEHLVARECFLKLPVLGLGSHLGPMIPTIGTSQVVELNERVWGTLI